MKRSLLVPCPACGRTRSADEGHHLCRTCEGYPIDDEFGITLDPCEHPSINGGVCAVCDVEVTHG